MLNRRKKHKSGIILTLLTICCLLWGWQMEVLAEDGSIYTATINATYRHPVTGIIEDAGGESGEAIGQGMVENVLASKGLMEIDTAGNIYLTIRVAQTDNISKVTFQVQESGASSWSNTQAEKTGESSAAHTADYRILLSSKNSVIKIEAYVEPMGRSVIFYGQPTNLTEGNKTDFRESVSNGQLDAGSVENQKYENILTNETGLTVSEGKNMELTENDTATPEQISETVAALLAESAENEAARQQMEQTANVTTTTEAATTEYIVMEDSAFLRVNRSFWLCLFLELVSSMLLAGLLLMGIKALIGRYLESRRRLRWEQGPEIDEYEKER